MSEEISLATPPEPLEQMSAKDLIDKYMDARKTAHLASYILCVGSLVMLGLARSPAWQVKDPFGFLQLKTRTADCQPAICQYLVPLSFAFWGSGIISRLPEQWLSSKPSGSVWRRILVKSNCSPRRCYPLSRQVGLLG
jgi:hypothetical protein